MTETKAQKRRRIARARYKSKQEALERSRRERAKGREATVRRDPRTGEWIVEVFVLLVALSIFGSLLRAR